MKRIILLSLLILSVDLLSAQQSGVIIIEPNPPDAKVFIDGKDVKDRDTLYVNTGRYFMKATAPGFYDFTDTISIAAGDTFSFSPIMYFNYKAMAEKSAFNNVKSVRILTYVSLGSGVLATIFALSASSQKEKLPERIDAYNAAVTPEEKEAALDKYNDTFDYYNSLKDAAIATGITFATSGIIAFILGQNYQAKKAGEKSLSVTDIRRFDPVVKNIGSATSVGFTYKF